MHISSNIGEYAMFRSAGALSMKCSTRPIEAFVVERVSDAIMTGAVMLIFSVGKEVM
jgi:hypothetical protein